MKKKLFIGLVICSFGVMLLTGCGNANKTDDTKTTKDVASEKKTEKKSKWNCSILECVNKIKIENTVEEINKIIGYEGKLTDEKYNKYYWNLSDSEGIEVTYYSSDKGTIKAVIDNDSLKDKKVDFSKYDEIKSALNAGEAVTYDEFSAKVGDAKGNLVEKSSITNKYLWVAKDGGYLNASFSVSSGKCTFVSGRIK